MTKITPTLKTACCTKYPEAGSPLGAPLAVAADASSGDMETANPVCAATAATAVAVCSQEEEEEEEEEEVDAKKRRTNSEKKNARKREELARD